MTRLNLTALASLLLILVAGCNDSFVGAENAATAEVDGLLLQLLAPDTVAPADSFEVRFVVQNRTGEDVAVTTPSGCLVVPRVTDGTGERVPLKGTGILCTAAITTHEIPAGGAVNRNFDMQAVLFTSEEEKPGSPGRFTVEARLDWSIDGEPVALSVIGRDLVVRP